MCSPSAILLLVVALSACASPPPRQPAAEPPRPAARREPAGPACTTRVGWPYYGRFDVRDPESGRTVTYVLEHDDLAAFLAAERGAGVDARGRVTDLEAFGGFVQGEYARVAAGRPGALHLDLDRFARFVGRRRFGGEAAGRAYLRTRLVARPLAPADLGFPDGRLLVEALFDLGGPRGGGPLRSQYLARYADDPALAALLIGEGYLVGRMALVPVLFVRVCP